MNKTKVPYEEMMKNRETRGRKLYSYIFNEKEIISGFRGSVAHGLRMDPEKEGMYGTSDFDQFSIYIFPLEYYISLEGYYNSKEVVDRKIGEDDLVKYEIRKAFNLLSGVNPNIISFLWNKPEHYTHISEGGKLLLENRQMFLSRRRIKAAY